MGTSRPLAEVFAAVAALAARAGDGDRAAATTFACESAALGHGWTQTDAGTPALAADTTAAGAAAWDAWGALINRTADGQFQIILPPPAGAPLAATTGTGRNVWAGMPGGPLLRVTTRPAGLCCHVVGADLFHGSEAIDSAAILAENIRAPHFDEAADFWRLNLSLPGSAVLARLTRGKITLRGAGRRVPEAVAEDRHILPPVAAALRPAVEARRARGEAEAAKRAQEGRARSQFEAEENTLAAVLGRPMPRRR